MSALTTDVRNRGALAARSLLQARRRSAVGRLYERAEALEGPPHLAAVFEREPSHHPTFYGDACVKQDIALLRGLAEAVGRALRQPVAVTELRAAILALDRDTSLVVLGEVHAGEATEAAR